MTVDYDSINRYVNVTVEFDSARTRGNQGQNESVIKTGGDKTSTPVRIAKIPQCKNTGGGGACARYLFFPGNLFFELLFLSQRLLLSAKRAIAKEWEGVGGGTRGKGLGTPRKGCATKKLKPRHGSMQGAFDHACTRRTKSSQQNKERSAANTARLPQVQHLTDSDRPRSRSSGLQSADMIGCAGSVLSTDPQPRKHVLTVDHADHTASTR